MPNRRTFLRSAASILGVAALSPRGIAAQAATLSAETILPPWTLGTLELHHIDTGRGNSTLVLAPDGTTLLIDAGEAHSALPTMPAPLPDNTRRAGEWIARYVSRQLARAGQTDLDLLLLTHLHGDHIGEVAPTSPPSAHGPYRLTGASDVAESLHIREVIDRAWPTYDFPAPFKDPSALNYIAFARHLAAHGTRIERANPGSLTQLALRYEPERYPAFSARILSANGRLWTGTGESSASLFPQDLTTATLPTENMCSISLRLQYGAFRYFTGGDLTADTDYGQHPWRDVETPITQRAGPVSVAVTDHHAYFDACGPASVRALQPRAWIIPAWHVSHPAMNVIANLFSTDLYPGPRSVFALGLTPEAKLVTERFSGRLSSTRGHVVVRVPPGGADFTVSVLDARNERGAVAATFGPFPS